MVLPGDYLPTILAAVIMTLESRIPAAGILVQTPYHPGCLLQPPVSTLLGVRLALRL